MAAGARPVETEGSAIETFVKGRAMNRFRYTCLGSIWQLYGALLEFRGPLKLLIEGQLNIFFFML